MVWKAPGKVVVVKVACPPEMLPLPSTLPPSRNWMDPVGAPEFGPSPLIKAVKVTACPRTDGFGLLLTDNEVLAGAARSVFDVLALKLPSPEYTAVTGPPGIDKVGGGAPRGGGARKVGSV